MNLVERIAKWVGVDVTAVNRPELVAFRETMDAARAAKRAEDFAEALDAFERAGKLCEQTGDVMAQSVVRLHMADIYTKIGQFEDAQMYINLVLRGGDGVYPTAPRAYAKVALGVLQLARGEHEAARDTLDDAASTARKAKSPGAEGRAMGYLAGTYLRDGNASYAAHLLREALPKLNMAGDLELSAPFITMLAEALLATGETVEADNLLSRGVRLAEQIKSRGDLRRLHVVQAKRALDLGHYTESYNQYEKALQFTNEDAPERALILREIATACLYLDKSQDALVYAERAVELRPDDLALRGTLGVIQQSIGRSEDALPNLKAAILAPETNYDTLRALAAAYVDTKRYDNGLKTLETALELAKRADLPLEVARTLRDIGHLHLRERRQTEAIKAWVQAIDLYEGKNVYSQAARLLCDTAGARLQLGQTTRAYKDYEQALMLVNGADDITTRGVVLSNAAMVYVEKGDLETAEAFFTEAIQIAQKTHDAPAEATRRGNFGWFLLNTGRFERAKTALQFALELSERLNLRLQVAVQTGNLAQTASELGDDEAAAKLYLRALATADGLDAPRWQSTLRSGFAQWLTANGRADEARVMGEEALKLAQTAHDAEAASRATIEIARAGIATDAQGSAAGLAPLVTTLRAQNNRRLLADALTVFSNLYAVLGKGDEARKAWEEARKLYMALEHPAKLLEPAWLAQPNA